MKQLYYAIQTILHGRGSNVTKVISLSLGLTVGILLFSQIAFELSYEKCYPEAGNLGIVRAYYHNLETGESMGISMIIPFLLRLEKPLNFDPFGHARFAHLFVLYD